MSPTWMNRPHTLGSRAALACLRLSGWTPLLAPVPGPRLVAPAAPHTANEDFWVGLFWKWATRTPVHFVGKHTLFRFPLGGFMRAVGGIPIDRRRRGGNFVDAVVEIIRREPEIVLLVAPEGTRAQGDYWKTGFYYMALEAGVPLAVMALDWGRKQVGIVGYVTPTGDIDADFAEIRRLLEGVRGKHPRFETPAFPRPADPA
ncbi:lysophospholipid acyltransferase family protein [Deinococcus radiodurans]|uniref:Phospholipid/glycerol acyltransferase domain-containing protein n=1 Tax=Deinococcus radiodurans (strain ATCC 13939 / DSM 20539 / JCM 16871 / CCUG 27074 / LMG 4051 / NBRC 15346 / NCIMB 9279 / VKM B-1422 / R1) TaxID=243230 RepID=Q9RRH7_DEIRA|nr:lysophospholipid acyltransferase family protein [Deinococcus radiodurans]AAF12061.1 hypothetical protein DR_2514 [Deinococcus radiodurans R1 = ATCC 13939 = DSM 20539]QEM71878.1 glycerol acyltransferase [Deinococcus radiodurans]UDL01520.1 glycerol acyltransferase [Deinococcus radiodurans R1 = ATCC 13939 = DSM 20539]